jgi:hypothetical protein
VLVICDEIMSIVLYSAQRVCRKTADDKGKSYPGMILFFRFPPESFVFLGSLYLLLVIHRSSCIPQAIPGLISEPSPAL